MLLGHGRQQNYSFNSREGKVLFVINYFHFDMNAANEN